MKKLLVLSAVLIGVTSASYAGVSFNINLGGDPFYNPPQASVIISHPAPVVYQPAQPVCETPAPVVYQPQPVCEPAPVVYQPQPVCEPAPQVVIAPRPVYRPAPRVVVLPEHHQDYRHSRDYAYNNHHEWNGRDGDRRGNNWNHR
jgi:hypothetical protein